MNMLKRLSFILILILVLLLPYATVMADEEEPKLPDIVYLKDTEPSEKPFLVTIKYPEDNVSSTFKRNFVIVGAANTEGISIKFLIYDRVEDKYVSLYSVDDESYWDIGPSGIFHREVRLPHRGQNKIRIVAFKKAEVGNLELGKNLQISDFVITFLDEIIKESIKYAPFNITESVNERVKATIE